ncbi:hypothetical protein FRX31_024249 [Thalictrum thalictroides]|uniref:Uncharacterized protein n=1 Tax=Thalictrum thalictroides TaxID=46969 RepID=A0A7J6VPN7_THATH|nr:hypothetical protein FRX31_024249 [Thalictrum thalictroides]
MEGVEVGLTKGRKQKKLQVNRSKRRKEPEVSLNKHSSAIGETSLENKNQVPESSFAKPGNGKLDVVLALMCPELSEKKTVKRSKKLPQSLKNNNVDQNMVEARTKKADEHKKVCAVQPKGKRTKNVDQNMVEARTKKADGHKKVCAVQSKRKKTKKLDSSDGKIPITSVNSGSFSEFNNKVNGNSLFNIPKQEDLVNKTVEATSEKTGEHKEVCTGQLKRKRTARRKKSPNTLVNNNQVEKKWGIILTSAVESGTVSEFNNKVGTVPLKGKRTKRSRKSQATLADISDQNIVDKKGDNSDGKNPTTSLNAGIVSEFRVKIEVPVDRTLEAASKTINEHDEVCSVQQKQKRKRELKSRTDHQGDKHPLKSGNYKLCNTLDQNMVVGKSDLFDRNISTTLPKTASNVSNKVVGNTLFETQNQGVQDKTLEATLNKMEEPEEAGAVHPKGKRTKRGMKSQETSAHVLDQSSDGKISTTSHNTEIVSEFNDKMDASTSYEIQNQEVPVDKTLEAASKTINEQDEVCIVQRKGKRKREKGVKCCTEQGNKHSLERDNNKISNTLDQNVVVGKSDPFDGKICTNSLKTASNVNLITL